MVMAAQSLNLPTCVHFPDFDGLIPTARNQPATIGTESEGCNDVAVTVRVWTSRPDATSQSFMVLSALAEASQRPSGLKATAKMGFLWPLSFCTSCPLDRFQILIVLSSSPEASSRPSGLKAT